MGDQGEVAYLESEDLVFALLHEGIRHYSADG